MSDFQSMAGRVRRVLEEQHGLAADLAELMAECRATGINGALLKKWLKAEIADNADQKLRKLVQDTEDQAIYGDNLGHKTGLIPGSQKNVSARAAQHDTPHDLETGEVRA